MRSFRNITLSALLTIGSFAAITYTACNKDECDGVVCLNNGFCVSGSCSCPSGYEGPRCETLTVSKFVGIWTGSDVCGTGTYNITLHIDPSSSNPVNAIITNPGGFGGTVTILGTVSGVNELHFSNQSTGGGRSLTGDMFFNGNNHMDFEYSSTEANGDVDDCSGTYTRQ